jgi:uncharacterized protein YdeI (BOF family)
MMKQLSVSAFALTTLLATASMAEESLSEAAESAMHNAKAAIAGTSISQIGAQGDVTISGEVTAIDRIDNEFTVRDASGSIDVEQESAIAVSVGDEVTVSGTVTKDLGEKEIAASKVTITTKATETDDSRESVM